MTWLGDLRPTSVLTSLAAALTTWVTLLSWTPFAERPAAFMVPLLGGCLLVALTGVLLRSSRLPAAVVLLGQALVVLLWLQHRLAAGTALGGLVPTPTSVRTMLDAMQSASLASQSYAAPVPASAVEFYPLLIVAGAAAALLVDFLGVGLRRAPLAGLPLLAVYTAPISVLEGGVSWVKFAVAALCFLFLIAATEEERLARWGHQLVPGASASPASGEAGRSGQAIWSSARKIGFTATALAVVMPALVPTFSASFFGGGRGIGNGGGDAVSISNPMVDLRRDLTQGADVDLITLRTADPDPSYLRISVLNSFDGNAWRPSGRDIPTKQRADGKLPKPPGLSAGVPSKTYAVRLEVTDAFESRWLPTPYPASSVNAPGDWRYDRSTMDFISAREGQTTAGLSYRLRSLVLTPSAEQLANAISAPLSVYTPNTSLPDRLPDYVRQLARGVTAGKVTRFEQAVALQQFFREDGGFRYSTRRSSGNGTDDLLRFLRPGRDGRVGYCEQFAAAMALMGRTLGIPSRVAVGFLHPDRTGADTYVYSTHDLHAWPEMYFGGVGWVRFEPTPPGRAGDVPGYTTQQIAQAPAPTASSAPSAAASANRPDRSSADQAAQAQTTRRLLLAPAADRPPGWRAGAGPGAGDAADGPQPGAPSSVGGRHRARALGGGRLARDPRHRHRPGDRLGRPGHPPQGGVAAVGLLRPARAGGPGHPPLRATWRGRRPCGDDRAGPADGAARTGPLRARAAGGRDHARPGPCGRGCLRLGPARRGRTVSSPASRLAAPLPARLEGERPAHPGPLAPAR